MWTSLIAAHAAAALIALGLGGWQLFAAPKGTPAHRLLGRAWVLLMLFVAISSFWITDLKPGRFSALHVLSAVTIATVGAGVFAARKGWMAAHRGNMTGSWLGLVGAFVFAVAIPDRHVPTFIVTEPVGAAVTLLVLVAVTAAIVAVGSAVASRVLPVTGP